MLRRQLGTRERLLLLLRLRLLLLEVTVLLLLVLVMEVRTGSVPTLEVIAGHRRFLLRVLFKVLLQQAEVTDELGVASRLLLHRRGRGGCVGAGRVVELRSGQRPGTGPRAGERLKFRVYLDLWWWCWYLGHVRVKPSLTVTQRLTYKTNIN